MELLNKAVRLVFFVVFFLLFSLGNAVGFNSKSEFNEIEEQIKVTTNRYMNLERSFEKVRLYLEKALPRTGLNVSLLKKGKSQYTIRAIELFLNGKPVLGHVYTEYESNGLAMGGRQLLYDEDTTQGVHLVGVRAFLQKDGTGKEVVTEKTLVKVQVFDDMTFMLEILLGEKNGKPDLRFKYVSDSEEMKKIVEKGD